jgi:hypothetical protein
MKTLYKQPSHEWHRMATRIHRANTASILRLAVFALTAPGVVSLAQAQSTVNAAAATAVTTTGGTANHVTKFSGANTIVNSGITEVNGNVGINTANPTQRLFVNGSIESTGSVFGAGGTTAPNPAFAFTTGGNTGMFSPVGGTIAFSTFGNERMRLNGSTGFLVLGQRPQARL